MSKCEIPLCMYESREEKGERKWNTTACSSTKVTTRVSLSRDFPRVAQAELAGALSSAGDKRRVDRNVYCTVLLYYIR